jgi:flavin-binding protein dodecin
LTRVKLPGFFLSIFTRREVIITVKFKRRWLVLVVKVMDLVGESNTSWDDAVKGAVEQASQSAGNITGVEVANLTAGVRDGKIFEYKANVRVAYKE